MKQCVLCVCLYCVYVEEVDGVAIVSVAGDGGGVGRPCDGTPLTKGMAFFPFCIVKTYATHDELKLCSISVTLCYLFSPLFILT